MATFFLPPLRTNEDAIYRVRSIEDINKRIFHLVYYGHFSFEDCENMTSVELKWFYNELRMTKEAEQKAHEDAIKSANEARKAAQQAHNNQPRRPIRK